MKKNLSNKQVKSNARAALFRNIHGYNLERLGTIAFDRDAITINEFELICDITFKIEQLKNCQFANAKQLGLNPRRRCDCCKNIAYWKATIIGKDKFLCNKHKKLYEKENIQNSNGELMITNIIKINPYE